MKCDVGTQANGKVTDTEPENDAFKNGCEAGIQAGRGALGESIEQGVDRTDDDQGGEAEGDVQADDD